MHPAGRLVAARPSLGFAVAVGLCLLAADTVADRVRYQLEVDNTWSEATHPGLVPVDAHFSFLGGGSHRAGVRFWEVGELASAGTVRMAEVGATDLLVDEVEDAVVAGDADASLEWRHWFCPQDTMHAKCGPTVVEFEMDSDFPELTLATMLGPSPDWFVGVSGLPLHDGAQWADEIVVDLRPLDGGTRSANVFALGGPKNTPPEPISEITVASGQIVTPASLGTMRFVLLPEPGRAGSLAALATLWALSGRSKPLSARRGHCAPIPTQGSVMDRRIRAM